MQISIQNVRNITLEQSQALMRFFTQEGLLLCPYMGEDSETMVSLVDERK
jgi:hypothetical protein